MYVYMYMFKSLLFYLECIWMGVVWRSTEPHVVVWVFTDRVRICVNNLWTE